MIKFIKQIKNDIALMQALGCVFIWERAYWERNSKVSNNNYNVVSLDDFRLGRMRLGGNNTSKRNRQYIEKLKDNAKTRLD